MTETQTRAATQEDVVAVLRLIEGALLEITPKAVREAIESETDVVCVALRNDRIIGTAVFRDTPAGGHVVAIAVHPQRRGNGVGRSLIGYGADRFETLSAEFAEKVTPFYERLGFTIEPIEGSDRYQGRLS